MLASSLTKLTYAYEVNVRGARLNTSIPQPTRIPNGQRCGTRWVLFLHPA